MERAYTMNGPDNPEGRELAGAYLARVTAPRPIQAPPPDGPETPPDGPQRKEPSPKGAAAITKVGTVKAARTRRLKTAQYERYQWIGVHARDMTHMEICVAMRINAKGGPWGFCLNLTTLGKELGLDRQQVYNTMKRLADRQFISRTDKHRKRSVVYRFLV